MQQAKEASGCFSCNLLWQKVATWTWTDLGLWASQSLSLPNSWVCNVWKMFPGAKHNTLLNDGIQYPWGCRYRSRWELWIMPVKDTPTGSATSLSFLISIFHELNETLWNKFLCPSLPFFCLPWGVGCPSFAELGAAASFAQLVRAVTHNVLPVETPCWLLFCSSY